MDTATIFYYEPRLLAGKLCFDLRFDAQKLPQGVVVVGFAYRDDTRKYHEVFLVPGGLTPEQKAQLQHVLAYARGVVRDDVEDWQSLQDAASLPL